MTENQLRQKVADIINGHGWRRAQGAPNTWRSWRYNSHKPMGYKNAGERRILCGLMTQRVHKAGITWEIHQDRVRRGEVHLRSQRAKAFGWKMTHFCHVGQCLRV